MTRISKTPDQQTLDIKSALMKKGIKITSIAKRLGVSSSAIHKVIAGTTVSNRIEEHLVDILGYDPFPERPPHDEAECQPRTA